MKSRPLLFLLLSLGSFALPGCKDSRPPALTSAQSTERIDSREKETAATLRPGKDPVSEEIDAFRSATRQAYNNRRFDELEAQAAELRASKSVFDNGSWKIVQFYSALDCDEKEPPSMWQLHDQIHQAWIAAKPASVTALVAYADFLTSYAWQARGSGFADTVTDAGAKLMEERLFAARKILREARQLPEKDPCWWTTALTLALGQGWSKAEYDSLVAEATAFEPKFWGYHTERAYSLLPRWYGEPGDWEAYAKQAAAAPDGLGAEIYARIVMRLRRFHEENIFRESQASWPQTRAGLEILLEKYPRSLDILSNAALLATMAQDREMAKPLFEKLGDSYFPPVWRKPERFVHYRNWAATGEW